MSLWEFQASVDGYNESVGTRENIGSASQFSDEELKDLGIVGF